MKNVEYFQGFKIWKLFTIRFYSVTLVNEINYITFIIKKFIVGS